MCFALNIPMLSYLLNCWWVSTRPSSRMGNRTSQLPTMFWILKSRNLAGKPSFCTTRAYLRAASLDCSSLFWSKHGQENKSILPMSRKPKPDYQTQQQAFYMDVLCKQLGMKASKFVSWINATFLNTRIYTFLTKGETSEFEETTWGNHQIQENGIGNQWAKMYYSSIRLHEDHIRQALHAVSPLGSSADHFSWAEDECCCSGLPDPHDDSCKTLQYTRYQHFSEVFCVSKPEIWSFALNWGNVREITVYMAEKL